MQRHVLPVLLMGAIGIVSAQADPLSLTPNRYAQMSARPPAPVYIAPQTQPVAAERAPAHYPAADPDSNLGGGFIEFLFSDGQSGRRYQPPPSYESRRALLPPMDQQQEDQLRHQNRYNINSNNN